VAVVVGRARKGAAGREVRVECGGWLAALVPRGVGRKVRGESSGEVTGKRCREG